MSKANPPVLGRRGWILAGSAAGLAVMGAAVGTAALLAGYAAWRRRGDYVLAGKTVLITGGSRGLGFALAREFLRQGSRVAICARDAGELRRAVEKLEPYGPVWSVARDVTAEGAASEIVEAVRQQWGAVDVLVHNAGVMHIGPWELASEEDFQSAMDLHCWAALHLAQAVLPDMRAGHQGRIVNICSIGGLVPVPHMLPYTTSKFALAGLSKGLATETRAQGVRVTCVCPFLLRTGSQGRVHVRGQVEREFAWFAASGSLPGVAQSVERAARSIVRACRRGDAQVVLWLGKLAAVAHGLAPSATTTALALGERWLLPPTPARGGDRRLGHDSYGPWSERYLRPRVEASGRRWNQA